jgi:hypothetical protein
MPEFYLKRYIGLLGSLLFCMVSFICWSILFHLRLESAAMRQNKKTSITLGLCSLVVEASPPMETTEWPL